MLNFVKDTANFLTCKRKALKSRHGIIGKTVIPVIRHYDVVHKGNLEQSGGAFRVSVCFTSHEPGCGFPDG